MSTSSLRFGILGCGAIAPTHAQAIRQLGHVVAAVADPIVNRASDLAGKSDARNVYADHIGLVADPSVDVVCVCTPSGMHADHAVAALEAGKHVIVEKPMEVTLEACDRMIAAAMGSGKLLGVCLQHRFDAASQIAKRLIDSGEIGRIVLATADVKWWRTQQYYDEGQWRGTWQLDGGGALMNQGVHTVDLLQWLCGPVKEVHARTRTAAHDRIEVEDVAVLSLGFESGAVGSLVASTAAFDGYPARIEIFGTEGSILLEGDTLKRVALKSGQTFDSASAAEHAIGIARGGTAGMNQNAVTRPAAAAGASWGDAHRAMIEDFVQAIHGGARPLVDASEGRRSVKLIVDAYAAARAG